ncbi:type 2A phosphatase activator TIP41 [Sodiomyces alkalinus F11]|uniref:Type 2A phosphatase activator TIP41 n=1 Tax=Sodiomyces alkalinus (strain CBS 110278 / VKM F-3762 / F11) TaxID=1314773 RepID=A0A3N2PNI7_SODAK|nr:type 2A phosphatase activator TIP41 [Sodiomyces alkalinus F11]ROT35994.1 type 2A phosphatase activator TIP41 [Sodiomyces alkalinus F11]
MDPIHSSNGFFATPSLPAAVAAATTRHKQGNFVISTRKLPISKAGPIDQMTERLRIPVPEMIFGDNLVSITHEPTGWCLRFEALDALDRVDKTDRNMLQVAYARDWSSSRMNTTAGIREVVKPYDWSYSTDYCGTLDVPSGNACRETGKGASQEEEKEDAAEEKREVNMGRLAFEPSKEKIPLELLKRRDPILFFDEVMLYESELDDNGISLFSVKVRVHQHRMLLLCRLFMRLDNVIVRVRDTRVYVDFTQDIVLREYTAKEDSFQNVKRALYMSGRLPDDITIALRDPNILAPLLPIVEQRIEEVRLG